MHRQEDRLKKLMVQQTTAVENEQDDSAIAMDKLASLAESVINSGTRPSRSRNLPLIGNKEVRSLAITNEEFIRDLNSGQSGSSGTSTEQNRATHQITTRSVTGRLAKKPKKDISPPHSPLRKLGRGIFRNLICGIVSLNLYSLMHSCLFFCGILVRTVKTASENLLLMNK